MKNIYMGRRTYKWTLERENKKNFSHLDAAKVDSLVEKYELKSFGFEDGNTYIVDPRIERGIMVEFYEKKEEAEGGGEQQPLHADNPIPEEELTGRYRITESAIMILTGDTPAELEMDPFSAIDFIPAGSIVEALEQNRIVISEVDGVIMVSADGEESLDPDTYPLILDGPLPGAEISIEELELKHRTAIEGVYRDDAGASSHEFEHLITRRDG